MNYLFFDTECANCFDGDGKICSFGYVLTDVNFNVIKKEDILINPQATFSTHVPNNDNRGISLAYSTNSFKKAKTFPSHYRKIMRLLTNKETIVFGFSAYSDMLYLIYTCNRYNLPLINFKCFDIQSLHQQLTQSLNVSGLDNLIIKYHLDEYVYHRSDDDALMSMEVLKKLLSDYNLDMNKCLEKYSDIFINTKQCQKKMIANKKKREEKAIKFEKRKALYSFTKEKEKTDPFFNNKSIGFFGEIINNKIDDLLKYEDVLYSKGGKIASSISQADILVFSKGHYDEVQKYLENTKDTINKKQLFITYNTFLKHLVK